MTGYAISNATAKAALRLRGGCNNLEGVAQIVAEVSRLSGVTVGEILGRGRTRREVTARDLVVFECRGLDLSYPQIGRALGRDHTSVMIAHRRAIKHVQQQGADQ